MTERHFHSYDEFFRFYLTQHSNPGNRLMHATGTVLGLVLVAGAILSGHAWYALLWPVIGYGFAWAGHFGIENNKPATFGHPWWSFLSDFRMLWLMITGQLAAWMAEAERQERSTLTAETPTSR